MWKGNQLFWVGECRILMWFQDQITQASLEWRGKLHSIRAFVLIASHAVGRVSFGAIFTRRVAVWLVESAKWSHVVFKLTRASLPQVVDLLQSSLKASDVEVYRIVTGSGVSSCLKTSLTLIEQGVSFFFETHIAVGLCGCSLWLWDFSSRESLGFYSGGLM